MAQRGQGSHPRSHSHSLTGLHLESALPPLPIPLTTPPQLRTLMGRDAELQSRMGEEGRSGREAWSRPSISPALCAQSAPGAGPWSLPLEGRQAAGLGRWAGHSARLTQLGVGLGSGLLWSRPRLAYFCLSPGALELREFS